MTSSTNVAINATVAEALPNKPRIASIDIFRGMVMFLMLFQMVHLADIAERLQEGRWGAFWTWIHFHTSHVEWEGGSLHDLIQPGFSFLVGSAMAFSLWNRQQKGESWWWMFLHALGRSFILVALGVLLRNLKTDRIDFRFEDTLCQIGLGYGFLFLIASLPRVWSYVAVVLILVGYWIAFASYPAPAPDFDYPSVGVPTDWPNHHQGFESHWNKNSNLAWAFDNWWVNQFPRKKPHTHNVGGYCTLSFIPTLATMILGLIAGGWLRMEMKPSKRISIFLASIFVCLSLALLIDYFALCPIVKRIWTPTWTLWSGGFCFAFLLFFHLICDLGGWKAWAFPLTVIGANSIAAYVMSFATVPFLRGRIENWFYFLWTPLGDGAPAAVGLAVFAIVWYILYWMHQHRLYVRI